MMICSGSSSQRRAECVGARGATRRWWPRTASWTTAPGHPGWTAARKPMSKPTLEDPKPDLLRARTSSMSGPYDLSDQVLRRASRRGVESFLSAGEAALSLTWRFSLCRWESEAVGLCCDGSWVHLDSLHYCVNIPALVRPPCLPWSH